MLYRLGCAIEQLRGVFACAILAKFELVTERA
jgi:hypothetical protein